MADRDELRAAAPELAAFVDECRRVFGEVKVTYLRLPDGREYGKKSENAKIHPADATPVAEVMAKWNRDNLRRAAGGRAK